MSTDNAAGSSGPAQSRTRRQVKETSAESARYVSATARFAVFASLCIGALVLYFVGAIWALFNYPPSLLVAGFARCCGGRHGGRRPADAVYMHALAWPLWLIRLARFLDTFDCNMGSNST